MFEAVKQGFVGLTLFIMNWAGPSASWAEIEPPSVRATDSITVVTCRMKSPWDPKIIDLVDAGVPLRFRFSARPENGAAVTFTRTLLFNVGDYSYMFRDSLPDYVTRSKKYPLVDLALKDFCEWEARLPRVRGRCTVTAEILPAYVSRLRRSVDMSGLWGQEKISRDVELK
ncbi:MAG: hypothetical protein V1913_09740 [Fibrobacterota bacterium]